MWTFNGSLGQKPEEQTTAIPQLEVYFEPFMQHQDECVAVCGSCALCVSGGIKRTKETNCMRFKSFQPEAATPTSDPITWPKPTPPNRREVLIQPAKPFCSLPSNALPQIVPQTPFGNSCRSRAACAHSGALQAGCVG